jgi:hypothetical protein
MWQGGASSSEIELFTRPTMAQPAAKFNASCGVRPPKCFPLKNCSPGAKFFRKILSREHESKNHHHPQKGRG